jgi:acyl-CoA synthetase (NDP forming)
VPGLALPDYLGAVTADPGVDAVVLEVRGGIPYGADVEELRVLGGSGRVPVLACWPGLEPAQRAMLIAAGIATFARAEQLWRSLPAFVRWQEGIREVDADGPGAAAAEATGPVETLPYGAARDLGAAAGLPQPRHLTLPAGAGERAVIGPILRGPVAVKASAAAIVHKADMGGVRLGIADDTELWGHVRELRSRLGEVDVTVEEMIEPGVEVLVSARRTEFGVLLTIGWGGGLTEVVGDVAEVMLPAGDDAILRAARTTRVWAALARAGDRDTAEKSVLLLARRVAELVRSGSGLALVEVNPAIVNATGATAADIRVLRVAGTVPGEGAQK